MEIEAIVFDVFGTLVEIDQAGGRIDSCLSSALGRHSSAMVS